jgi:hypothetical protein
MGEICQALCEMLTTVPEPKLRPNGEISKASRRVMTKLRSTVSDVMSHYNRLEALYGLQRVDVVEVECQTEPEEPSHQEVVIWATLPLDLEDRSSQWKRWYETQSTIKEMIVYSRELMDPEHPAHDQRDHLRSRIAKRIPILLEEQVPLDMPIKEDVRRCWDASTWEKGPSDPSACPVSDGRVYHRAVEAEKRRREPYKIDARATNCTVPQWVPREEWPLWKWDDSQCKHVRNNHAGAMRDGPYWIPRSQWNRWSRDREFGWVPMSPEIQDNSEWTSVPGRGWVRKAILEEEEELEAGRRAYQEQSAREEAVHKALLAAEEREAVKQSVKHQRDQQEDIKGPSEPQRKKRKGRATNSE